MQQTIVPLTWLINERCFMKVIYGKYTKIQINDMSMQWVWEDEVDPKLNANQNYVHLSKVRSAMWQP